MESVKSFTDLRTWQEAHSLTLEIYRLTALFPKTETYGLVSQLRRAVSSIPTNIAEGMGRASTKDFIRFLMHSRGSSQEVLYQILLAKDLGYIQEDVHATLSVRLNGLAAGINAHIASLERFVPL